MNIKKISFILKKELKDTLRDKRAFFISIIFPVILFPLIFSVLDINIQNANRKIKNTYDIGLIEQDGSVIRDFLFSIEKFNIIENNLDNRLKNGKIYAFVKSETRNGKREITVNFDNSRQHSLTAAAELTALLESLTESFKNKNIVNNENFLIKQNCLYNKNTGSSMLIMSTLLPFLLFVFAALSPVALASDTGAGEKERFTLEPLLANPVTKTEILAGKYLCLIVMGIAGTIAFSTGIVISGYMTPGVFGFEKLDFYMETSSVILLLLTAVILTMLFSSAELLLSLTAKSPKEAQILFLPLMMITMTAGYITSVIDPLNIDAYYRHIPLLNLSLLIKEISLNRLNPLNVFSTFSWSLSYTAVCMLVSVVLISRETIVKRE